MWACASTSFPVTKLCNLSLGPMIYLSKLDPVAYLSLFLRPRSQAVSMTRTPCMRMGSFKGHRGCQQKVETSPGCCWSCIWGETHDRQPRQSQLCNQLSLTSLWWHDTVSGYRNHAFCIVPCPILKKKGYVTCWAFLLQSQEKPHSLPYDLERSENLKHSKRVEFVMLWI